MSTKFFISTLLNSLELNDDNMICFNDQVLEYIWIQGLVVSIKEDINEIEIDDGTALITVLLSENISEYELKEGIYIMVHGRILIAEDETTGEPVILVENRMLSSLENQPNMETLWNLEVIKGMKNIR
jgi:RNase P/RNase MRP subunit p29